MKVVGYYPSNRPIEMVRHSNGKTVSESGHLISVTIRTALVSENSKLNFYDPNLMNITIQHKIYCPNPIREFRQKRKKIICICIRSIRSVFIPTNKAAGKLAASDGRNLTHARRVNLTKVRPLLPTGLLPDGTKGEQGMAR
jgi:hypothetical protein